MYNGAWENYDNGYSKCEDGSYLITNNGVNANIEVGASIKVSYIFKTQDEVVEPTYHMFLYENSLNDGDYDGLPDYEEVFLYRTNPKDPDTDKDGLNDGAEVKLGFNPLLNDSNNDGILDGQEKTEQNLECAIEEQECAISNVSIQINGTGLVSETTEIQNTFGIDMLSTGVVGLVGVPVNIETKSEFDRATITFAYDESKLGDVNEDDLRIMWYDEENNNYVILNNETVLDKENNTLSYTTTHFSTYLVVDQKKWYECWRSTINYRTDDSQETQESQNFDVCFVVDRSGSMSGNSIITAKDSMLGFNEAMHYDDRVAIVGFDSTAQVHLPFICPSDEAVKNSIGNIRASGGTNVESGLVAALDLFDKTEPQMNDNGVKNEKMMILLCDGDVYYTEATLKRAKDAGIRIYTVLIGWSSGRTALEHIAEVTEGKFYSAQESADIRDAIYGINRILSFRWGG
ncbi:von Willebrand factor type A domain-containing protein [Hathewaya proteolytica DSM 3090]|uniref:von Willebrand factor type A domain-containing protein n=1 Tax=Hathewaya proteolytica DSM 3090 TaxID=1121331 RepID=A0A1M6RVL3_9CLOT|nr:vWA domain-containing protein [Hathewaya proteolytica]SHK36494.1 von Willebrand factor type A domain-containing protein [Hathewaya proteolytica DSM 3090]